MYIARRKKKSKIPVERVEGLILRPCVTEQHSVTTGEIEVFHSKDLQLVILFALATGSKRYEKHLEHCNTAFVNKCREVVFEDAKIFPCN
jgi:hypothetical protein